VIKREVHYASARKESVLFRSRPTSRLLFGIDQPTWEEGEIARRLNGESSNLNMINKGDEAVIAAESTANPENCSL
jgi:hypothetical protein